jgi:hypothetical protein
VVGDVNGSLRRAWAATRLDRVGAVATIKNRLNVHNGASFGHNGLYE